MAVCAWQDEPCDRTDHVARGLCVKHYGRAKNHNRLDEYDTTPTLTFEAARDLGLLVCHCAVPRGPLDGECSRCRRLILSPERAAYLRARRSAS